MKSAALLGVILLLPGTVLGQTTEQHPADLAQLVKEYREWHSRTAAQTSDIGARLIEQKRGVADYRRRVEALSVNAWTPHAKVDYLVLRSELDNLDFDLRIIREESRNPDYYVTAAARAVSRNIGGRYQTSPGVPVPYDAKRAAAILDALKQTSHIVGQAPKLLTEAVGEMADVAIERLDGIQKSYGELARVLAPHLPAPYGAQVGPAAQEAGAAMQKYREWLQANRGSMKAPYAIGRPAFEWYVRNVMFMPYDSQQLLTQADMERQRGWAFLALERQKNRNLPESKPARDNHEYSEWKDATDVLSRLWAEEYELFSKPDDVGPMRDREGGIWIEPFGMMAFPSQPIPAGHKVEFIVEPDHWFSKIYWEIGHRLDPGTNHPHSDYPGHTFEGAVSQRTTCELRRGHRSRGDAWTYYMEDAQLQLDYPFVRGPRVREWMYSLLIMRAERVHVGVKFAAGEMTPQQVTEHFMKNVPGMEPHVATQHEVWRKYVDPAQVLTYQVGRSQVYQLLADRQKQLGDKFDLKAFNDALLATGQIPVALARYEMTGLDDEVKVFLKKDPMPTSGTK